MIHQLKIQDKYFEKIISNKKTFELRKDDRGYRVGDYLGLNEATLKNGEWKETGRFVLVKVEGILDEFVGIEEGYVIMSITPCQIGECAKLYVPYYDCSHLEDED